MFESFSLESPESKLHPLWSRDVVQIWSAGADLGAPPAALTKQAGLLVLLRGRLSLGTDRRLTGPALVVLVPGRAPKLEVQDPDTQVLFCSVRVEQKAGAKTTARILDHSELGEQYTLTVGSTLVHWLPRREVPKRRSFAGVPSLVLNVGVAPLPIVAGSELHPLAANEGGMTDAILTVPVPPGAGPVVVVERLES